MRHVATNRVAAAREIMTAESEVTSCLPTSRVIRRRLTAIPRVAKELKRSQRGCERGKNVVQISIGFVCVPNDRMPFCRRKPETLCVWDYGQASVGFWDWKA